MVPVIVLVGHPNVGKSTPFNHLTRTHDALVADSPGLTRDRKYGRAEVEDHEFICIDTGGIDGTEEGMETRIAEQSLLVIEEADVALPMVGARVGLIPTDVAIAKHLRSREKSTSLVADKTDGIDVDQAMTDFWSPGLGDICLTVASHGHGVISLPRQALLPWVDEISPQEEVDEDAECRAEFGAEQSGEAKEEPEDDFSLQDLPIKLAIVEHPNVGKSTPTSRILDENRMVVYDVSGTTRDSIYTPMQRDEREYVLIDTAGVHKYGKITDVVERSSVIKTLQAIEDTNVTLLVIDAREGVSDQDLSLLDFTPNSDHSLMIVVDKQDGLNQEAEEQMEETLGYHSGFINFTRVHFTSALHGSGVDNLSESVRETYDSATRRVGTATLTRVMNTATEDHQPPLVCSCYVKLRYAHAGGYNSSIVMTHGNQVKDLPDSYKRYLMSYSHKSLDMIGTPIQIQLKKGGNPFANKCNTLTLNQMHKRKRLIKHIKEGK